MLHYVTAFVARLTHRAVLLQTSVAALFPLRGTIHGTGRHSGVRATDRWMRKKRKRLANTHRRATLCHLQSRCLSGFLMAKVTDVADEQAHACDPSLKRPCSDGPCLQVTFSGGGRGGSYPQKQCRSTLRVCGISHRRLTQELEILLG